MTTISDLLGLIGNLGNAAGIQGDNPAGYNYLQRADIQDPSVQAHGLAALASNADFQSADPAVRQQMIQQVAPSDIQAQIAAKTKGETKGMKNINFSNPDIIQDTLNRGNPAELDVLAKTLPLIQQQNFNNALTGIGGASSSSGQNQSNANTFINNTLGLEGGVSLDGKSIFGIDAKANPDEFAKIKQIQQTKGDDIAKAESANFLKSNYYDPHAQDIERLSPQQGQIVFDSFVNHRSDFANQVLGAAKAGASPDQLIGMRQQEYQRLAQSDAGKPANEQQYAPNLPGWNNRLTNLRAQVGQMGQQPSGQGYAGMAGKLPQPTPSAANQNAPQVNTQYAGMPADYNPPPLPANEQRMRQLTPLALSKFSNEQGKAWQSFVDNMPGKKAQDAYTENYYKTHGQMQEKQNEDNISYAKDIHEDAQNAIRLNDSLAEMAKLRDNFQPGKLAPIQATLAAWKTSLGLGSDEDEKLAAAVQGEEKLAIQNVTGQLKQLSSRPSQMEFMRYLEANPNLTMTPQGFDTIMQYMRTQANLPLQKEQEFSQWKDTSKPENYREFDTQWNKKMMDTQSNRMVAAQGTQTTQNEPITKTYKRVGGKLVLQ